ncbi:hypothetical protein Tco_0917007 [Tanacetum coccineum]
MNGANIAIKEYIRLEEEKAQSRGETFNWQTATFGRMEHHYEEECFTNFEEEFPAIAFGKLNAASFDTEQRMIIKEYEDEREDSEIEFPAIVLNNTSSTSPSYEPTVSDPNKNKINFRISLDESDDEDYAVFFDENSFSYKIISNNNLKTDSGNDNDNMPSSPKPTINYLDDLDCFKNEFPAIVYNDGLVSEPDPIIKPFTRPQPDHKNVDKINSEQSWKGIVINVYDSAHGHGLSTPLKTNREKWKKIFNDENLFIELNVNIMVWYYFDNGIPLCLFKNLYVPFGIPLTLNGIIRMVLIRILWRPRMSDTVMDLDAPNTLCFQLGGERRSMTWR